MKHQLPILLALLLAAHLTSCKTDEIRTPLNEINYQAVSDTKIKLLSEKVRQLIEKDPHPNRCHYFVMADDGATFLIGIGCAEARSTSFLEIRKARQIAELYGVASLAQYIHRAKISQGRKINATWQSYLDANGSAGTFGRTTREEISSRQKGEIYGHQSVYYSENGRLITQAFVIEIIKRKLSR